MNRNDIVLLDYWFEPSSTILLHNLFLGYNWNLLKDTNLLMGMYSAGHIADWKTKTRNIQERGWTNAF